MFKLKNNTILLVEYGNAEVEIEQPEEGHDMRSFTLALTRATFDFLLKNRKRGSTTDIYYEVGRAIGKSLTSVYRYMVPVKQPN
jgi:hypothetical protein